MQIILQAEQRALLVVGRLAGVDDFAQRADAGRAGILDADRIKAREQVGAGRAGGYGGADAFEAGVDLGKARMRAILGRKVGLRIVEGLEHGGLRSEERRVGKECRL